MVNKNNWKDISKACESAHTSLVAVSKTRSIGDIKEMYDLGQRIFGENRVQELLDKKDELPQDIEWHLIGHLQRNKVKYIAPFISLIHGVDSLRLLKEINKEAKKNNKLIDCLLQFHIAQEESKFGIPPANAIEFIDNVMGLSLDGLRIRGVMGMASFVDDDVQVIQEFSILKGLYSALKDKYFSTEESFDIISMGMSSDYQLALREGSTMLRVGSKLFV
tara:strand:+ start:212 stop:871 length:660 start_codon:yes stop_codon:yes gene_type:complete